MRISMWMIGACLGILSTSACSETAHELSPEERQAVSDSVQTFLDGYLDAMLDGRWAEVAEAYSSDSRLRLLEDGRVAYRDRAQISEALASLGDQFPNVEIAFGELEILPLAPGLAEVLTTYEQSFSNSEGAGFELKGALSFTLIHEPLGWRILVGHTSTLRPAGDWGG